jgi:chromate transporter
MAKKVKDSLITALKLFSIFFYVAIFTVGGGIAMVPVLERILVKENKYLSDKEFTEIFSIAQILPGSLMINMATFTGYKIAKFLGALFCCIAITIPPLTIITLIAVFYGKFIEFAVVKKLMLGILAGVVGEVAGITLNMFRKTKFNTFKIFLLLFSFLLIFILGVNPIYVVIIGALLGIILGKED